MVCKECITHCFLDEDTKMGSFIYMHRLFCLKKNIVQKIAVDLCEEPLYLRAMRDNGREVTVEIYEKEALRRKKEEEADEDGEGLISDKHDTDNSENEGTITPIMYEDDYDLTPYGLKELKNIYDKIFKKYLKFKKYILDLQISIEKKGHTVPFLERLKRIKEEAMVEFIDRIQNKLDILDWKFTKIEVHADFEEDVLEGKKKIQEVMMDVNLLYDMKSIREYNNNVMDLGTETGE